RRPRCRGLAAGDAGGAGGAAVDAGHESGPRGDVLAAGGGGESGLLVLTPCSPLRDAASPPVSLSANAASPPVPLSANAERGDEGQAPLCALGAAERRLRGLA